MNNTTKVIVGLAVAAAAGAAVGMLLTTENGADLQKRIKNRASEWLTEFSSLLNTGKELIAQFKSRTANESTPATGYAEIESKNGNYID
jgi:gas vesicle protein